ncbi:MAG: AraC family transcriptional regulator [Planctomycetota bacterium]
MPIQPAQPDANAVNHTAAEPPRGLLHRDGLPERFALRRYHASATLAEIVDTYWITRWNRLGMTPHLQEVLPHPNVQVVVQEGRSGVFGIGTGRAEISLAGRGRAVGIKLQPGAFPALVAQPASQWTNTATALDIVFGAAGRAYERTVLATDDDADLVAAAETFLLALTPNLDDDARWARRLVEAIAADPTIVRVEDLAARDGVSVRRLQRLFREYVGVPPKWVIQRYRLHEVVQQLESGGTVHLAELAVRLHYYDQAHLTREFTKLIGVPPARYAAAMQKEAP